MAASALLFTSISDNLPVFMISLFVTLVMVTGGIDIRLHLWIGLTSITIGVQLETLVFLSQGAVGVALVLICCLQRAFGLLDCVLSSASNGLLPWARQLPVLGLALLISTLSQDRELPEGGSSPRTSSLYLTSSSWRHPIPASYLHPDAGCRVHSAAQDQVWSSHHPGWR